MGTVLSIEQLSAIGPHFYKVVALIPPGQGEQNKLYIKLPAAGSIGGAQSEPAMLNYKPPSSLKMNVHHFPTKGGTVDLTGMDLGLCAVLLVDGVQVQHPSGEPCTNGRGNGTLHVVVTFSHSVCSFQCMCEHWEMLTFFSLFFHFSSSDQTLGRHFGTPGRRWHKTRVVGICGWPNRFFHHGVATSFRTVQQRKGLGQSFWLV